MYIKITSKGKDNEEMAKGQNGLKGPSPNNLSYTYTHPSPHTHTQKKMSYNGYINKNNKHKTRHAKKPSKSIIIHNKA